MTANPAKVEARYVGDCSGCGRLLAHTRVVQSTATGDGEWVRCGDEECRTITRIPLEEAEGQV